VRALAISDRAHGAEHQNTGLSLNNLALLYKEQGSYAKAEPLLLRALAINERALGANHSLTGASLNNLALMYTSQGKYAKAEPLYVRALAISERALGSDHPLTGMTLNNLAWMYSNQRVYAKAEPLYMRALAISEVGLGQAHPDTLLVRRNFALAAVEALLSGQNTKQTPALLRRNLDALTPEHLKALDLEVAAGSREVRVAALDRFRQTLKVLSKVQQHWPELRPLTLNQFAQGTLHSRGRLLEETQAAIDALRRRPGNSELSALIDQLGISEQEIVRASRSKESLNVDALYEKRERILAAISSKSRDFRDLTRIPSVAEITALLAGSAAVEFVTLSPRDQEDEHYFAVVWTDKGPVSLKDLGLAKPIREAAERYGLALSVPDNGHRLTDAATQLARLLLHPYWSEVLQQGAIYFSPDGPLAGVAFDRLPDPDGKSIGDTRSVSLVGSLRDLAKWQQQYRSEIDPVGFFDPDFGVSRDGRPDEFPRLRSTLLERDMMEQVWPKQFQDFIGDKATKATLFGDKMKRPRILHIATQGFHRSGGDPLLETGIALAGANESEEKGVVTATDMARLNLQGTQLVVLSACESGLGGSSLEEGLLGMQRSLTLAGARSQLLTLWKVPTEATVAFMKEFYKRLKEPGRPKAEALRMAKSLMRDQGRAEWEWAGFVLYGDPGPLGQ
jgi:CHAT domain-containing protein/Tfp pilus assembly protein PilF